MNPQPATDYARSAIESLPEHVRPSAYVTLNNLAFHTRLELSKLELQHGDAGFDAMLAVLAAIVNGFMLAEQSKKQ